MSGHPKNIGNKHSKDKSFTDFSRFKTANSIFDCRRHTISKLQHLAVRGISFFKPANDTIWLHPLHLSENKSWYYFLCLVVIYPPIFELLS